jgi:hypothetical protein
MYWQNGCRRRSSANFTVPVRLVRVWFKLFSETEKYAHVTFFFNGGREITFEGEERCMVPSPKVKLDIYLLI